MKIVVFSGAGLSKESGIPTFRDSLSGLWENFKVDEVASPEGWYADKDKVLKFYEARWNNIKACEPNAAHKALAQLEKNHEVHHITQNIDDLLERAGCTNVWHIHGSIDQRKCSNPYCDYMVKHNKPVVLGDKCPNCKSQARPNVVWFGEFVDTNDKYVDGLRETADMFIGVGSSIQVHPAAGFVLYHFIDTKHKFFIDPDPNPRLIRIGYKVLTGKAAELVPTFVNTMEEFLAQHQPAVATA